MLCRARRQHIRDFFRVCCWAWLSCSPTPARLPVVKVRPHRRSICKTALSNPGINCVALPAIAATSSRYRLHHGVGFRAAAPSDGVSPVGGDLNLLRSFADRRFSTLGACIIGMLGLPEGSPQSPPLQNWRIVFRNAAEFHARLRPRSRATPSCAATDFYEPPRGAAVGLTTGLHPLDSTTGKWYRPRAHMIWIFARNAPARPRPFEISAASRTRSS